MFGKGNFFGILHTLNCDLTVRWSFTPCYLDRHNRASAEKGDPHNTHFPHSCNIVLGRYRVVTYDLPLCKARDRIHAVESPEPIQVANGMGYLYG